MHTLHVAHTWPFCSHIDLCVTYRHTSTHAGNILIHVPDIINLLLRDTWQGKLIFTSRNWPISHLLACAHDGDWFSVCIAACALLIAKVELGDLLRDGPSAAQQQKNFRSATL